MQSAGQGERRAQGRPSNQGQRLAAVTVSLAQDPKGHVRCWAVHPGKLATRMGQGDAAKSPRVAASGLLESDERLSPSFVSLGAPDLDW